MNPNEILESIATLFDWEAIDLVLLTVFSYAFVSLYKVVKNTYEDIRLKRIAGQSEVLKTYIEITSLIEQTELKLNWEPNDYQVLENNIKSNRLLIEYSIFYEILEKIKNRDISSIKKILEKRIEELYFITNELKDYSKKIKYIFNWTTSFTQLLMPIMLTLLFLLISSTFFIIVANQPTQIEAALTLVASIIFLSTPMFLLTPYRKHIVLWILATTLLLLYVLVVLFDEKIFYIILSIYIIVLMIYLYTIIIASKIIPFKVKNNVTLTFESHLQEIIKILEIKNLPSFIYGKENIIEHCKNKYTLTSNQINKLEKKMPSGMFLWIDEYTVCIRDKKISRIGTLAHELRHAYQYASDSTTFDNNQYQLYPRKRNLKSLLGVSTNPYSRKEWDANCFAMTYCWRNRLYKEAIGYIFRLFMPFIITLLPFIVIMIILLIYCQP